MTLHELVRNHLADWTALASETIAVLLIGVGTLEAGAHSLVCLVRRRSEPGWRKRVWSGLGMWLLLALQFALAADIVRSAISPSWQDIGQLAAIAAVRTFLGYFLERDLRDLAEGPRDAEPATPRP